jgi:periplasmic copper chaperone A
MSRSPRRAALRAATVLGVVAGTALLAATPALAHVTANSDDAQQGGYAVVQMRVPNESDTAGTIKLETTIPTDHPITSVRVQPVPGWTATLTNTPLNPPLQRNGRTYNEVVGTITWTANPGVRINPGEYTDFPVSLGPLPTDTGELTLPSTQTYDDGEVVAWAQPPNPDGSEPDRPAPSLTLAPAAAGGDATASATPATAAAPAAPAGGVDTTARWLGGVGLLLGALGLGLGGGALLRSRRSGGTAAPAAAPADPTPVEAGKATVER